MQTHILEVGKAIMDEPVVANPMRVLPPTVGPTSFFWTSGSDGKLRFLRCRECGYRLHPPAPICPTCHSRELTPAPVSGLATLYSFTVNQQPWDGSPRPYVIAIVELPEQEGLRLLTNVVDVDPSDVRIGMALEVVFESHGAVHLPLFRPTS
jgi:uncharacterized protein